MPVCLKCAAPVLPDVSSIAPTHPTACHGAGYNIGTPADYFARLLTGPQACQAGSARGPLPDRYGTLSAGLSWVPVGPRLIHAPHFHMFSKHLIGFVHVRWLQSPRRVSITAVLWVTMGIASDTAVGWRCLFVVNVSAFLLTAAAGPGPDKKKGLIVLLLKGTSP